MSAEYEAATEICAAISQHRDALQEELSEVVDALRGIEKSFAQLVVLLLEQRDKFEQRS